MAASEPHSHQILAQERPIIPTDRPFPEEKSNVKLDPNALEQTGKFEKGDSVHMSITQDGIRIKGIFTIHRSRLNSSKSYVEYQLKSGEDLYNNGEWIRENKLKLEKRSDESQ